MFRHITVVAVMVGLAVGLNAADKRPVTELDLFRFTWIADPQISPDGSRVAYVRVIANKKDDGYETSLWIVPTGGGSPRPLTVGTRDTAPRWSPDGRQLAFLRSLEPAGGGAPPRREDGGPQPAQIYVMPTDGGEARAITRLARGTGAPVWSPDGTRIAFTSTTAADDVRDGDDEKKIDAAKTDEPRKSDVRVITRAAYRTNGGGYPDPTRPTHIWTVEVDVTQGVPPSRVPPKSDALRRDLAEALAEAGSPAGTDAMPRVTQITRGEFDEQDPEWAPDGSRIYFTSNRVAEPYYLPADRDLYSVPAAGGDIEKVASIDGVIG